MDIRFVFDVVRRARIGSESTAQPLDGMLSLFVRTSGGAGGGEGEVDGLGHGFGRPVDLGQAVFGMNGERQAASGGGEIVFDGQEEAFAFVDWITANCPKGAGRGDEGHATQRAEDGSAVFFAELAHDEHGDIALARNRREVVEQRLGIGVRAAEVGANRIDYDQPAIGERRTSSGLSPGTEAMPKMRSQSAPSAARRGRTVSAKSSSAVGSKTEADWRDWLCWSGDEDTEREARRQGER